MPTGYTADVADGKIDFRTFALRCARAFGATVMQRDESLDSPPRHRQPSVYYAKRLAEASADVERYRSMTLAEAAEAMAAERAEHEEREAQYRAEKDAKRERYEAMLREAQAWEPPTAGHAELKVFMVKQLSWSIDFDCRPYNNPYPHTDSEEWLASKRAQSLREVERAETAHREEEERVASSNAWIDSLYGSLSGGEQ